MNPNETITPMARPQLDASGETRRQMVKPHVPSEKSAEALKRLDELVQTEVGKIDPRQRGSQTATKHDDGKAMMSLIPVRAKIEVAKVFTFGAVLKPNPDGTFGYGIGNWHSGDGFDFDRLQSASERHGDAFALGEELDPQSQLHHLAHRIASDMMLLEMILTGHGCDNRAKTQLLPDHEPVSKKKPI